MVLQYELADLRERIIAFIIDFLALFFGLSILTAFAGNLLSATLMEVFVVVMLCVFFFYSLALENLNNGQSLGKMAMGTRVIKTTHGRPTFADYAARWVFRLVDIYLSLGGIASILIASSPKGQRIGDIVANTAVVKLAPQMNMNLSNLLSIHADTNYKPEFTQAKQLTEHDVLLIKSALDRHATYNNQAHAEALQMLADKIAAVLHIVPRPSEDRRFLQTILKDYVLLTR